MQPYQPSQSVPTGGLSRLKIIGLVAAVVVLGVLGMFGNYARTSFFGSGRRGTAGYGQLGIDPTHADGDRMRTSVAGFATRWKYDAVWWGLTYSYVGPDGTMDLSKGGAVVQYVSLSSAKSFAKSVNQDAIKDFRFGGTDVSFNTMTGARDPKSWANAAPPAPPTCTIKQVAQALGSKGLVAGKTVRIMYDQQFAFAAPAEPSWHVVGEDPKIDAYYSMSTCAQTFASTH